MSLPQSPSRRSGSSAVRPPLVVTPVRSLRTGWRAFPLEILLLVCSGTGAFLVAETDAQRSIPLVAGVVLCFAWRVLVTTTQASHSRIAVGYGTALVCFASAIGLWGMGLGLFRENDIYYIAADAYHWFVEGLSVAILAALSIARTSVQGVRRGLVMASGALALVTFAGILAAYFGLVEHGGQFVLDGWMWQIKMGVNFPQVLLLYVTAICFLGYRRGERTPKLAWIVWIALLVILAMTLKRTMWLSSVLVLSYLFVPRGWPLRALLMGTVCLVIIANVYLISWGTPLDFLDALSYNPNYTVEDTLSDRRQQLNDALSEFQQQWGGMGFGAELYVFVPDTRTIDVTHYIHSNYIYTLIQLGFPGLFAVLAIGFSLVRNLCRRIDLGGEWEWLLRASLGAVMTLAINSLTLNATHSLYAGLACGLATMSIIRSREDGRVDR